MTTSIQWEPGRVFFRSVSILLFVAGLSSGAPAVGPIQDNSFLIEEAYNQESHVVQHINTFMRMWNSKDWSYSFTQEWPGLHHPRHQYSFTLTGMHAGALAGSGAGPGDAMLNYRYQWIGRGDVPLAVAPRLSVLAPLGSVKRGRGNGGPGLQLCLPASVVLHRRIVTHWNVSGTFLWRAQDIDHNRANALGYGFGQSVVFLAHPNLNALLETSFSGFQSVTGPAAAAWSRVLYLNPGIRWAHNFSSGLQIVPGVAVPVGIGPSRGARGVFVYLSLEHPFGKENRRP